MKSLSIAICLTIFLSSRVNAQIDFLRPVKQVIGSFIECVAIGDVNGDGRNDAVAASWFNSDPGSDYTVFVFIQQPDGSMAQPLKFKYPPAYSNRPRVQVADVNNDHRNDVLLSFGDSLGIFYQNSSGSLAPMHSLYCGNDTGGLKAGDLNNDGLTDIAVLCHWNDLFIKVFYQQSSGGFQIKTYPIANHGYDELDINDMNGDGFNDLIYMPGQGMGGTLFIFYQDSLTGLSQTPISYDFSYDGYKTFTGIGTGDLNTDGRIDLVGSMGGNEGHAWIAIIYQKTDGTLGPATFLPSYDIPAPVEIADLNCDNKNEIIVGHEAWSHFSVWEQDVNGNYGTYKLFGSLYYVGPYGLAVGDLNNDSRDDVLSTSGYTNVYFMYNATTPQGTLPIDTLNDFTYQPNDTLNTWHQTIYTYGIAKVGECLLKANYKLNQTSYTVLVQGAGDSLFARSYTMCGKLQADTLRHHYEVYKYIYPYHNDTTIVSVDTLLENKSIFNLQTIYDTTGVYQYFEEGIRVNHEYKIIGDSVFFITDSLYMKDHYHIFYYIQTDFVTYIGTKCGAVAYESDTLVNNNHNYQIVSSDTVFISRTVIGYPLGINEKAKIAGIRLYPNPASTNAALEFTNELKDEGPFRISLVNAMGQKVWEEEVPAEDKLQMNLDIKNLESGFYTVVIMGRKSSGAARLIISK
jgi:hypothetical protein